MGNKKQMFQFRAEPDEIQALANLAAALRCNPSEAARRAIRAEAERQNLAPWLSRPAVGFEHSDSVCAQTCAGKAG